MGAEKIRVLLAEDDKNLGNVLKSYLDIKGYDTTLCVNGQEALNAFMHSNFDFCIVDVMMPVKDGFTLVKEIRQKNKRIPVLFLTAKSMQEDKLKGFSLGADDYLTKPFSMEELLVRMQAIIRRANARQGETGNNIFRIGQYTFDYNRQLLKIDGKEQKLTSKESALLRLLAMNLNDVLDRSHALKEIWNDDSYFNARSMDVYITKLRKFLKGDETVELINVHGIGFKLVTND
ncbi:MAG: response regulator transcription factor [Bacteroidales bacterium]|jgi:DNA-binding response OmpR family regulator|nr:response regulator transcription factor [Bacteroidales bacterium]NCU35620.1 response regulator transcription factor [Candidatus Falkowbacteria bacterium]MDD2632749.1 response regulator transcription factor [Bacteroidales bacterium]MDD3527073.1 response regulator transcription factor [Bacteroidales bacterium]MDD4175551.1 response regulator transcription factor [Bacteroidales bacterium]